MADIYKISVAIGMTDNASQVLQALGRNLLGLNLKIKDIEGGLNKIKVAALGLSAVMAGREIVEGWSKMAEAGAKLQAAQIAMTNAGMSHLEVVKETARAYQSMSDVKGPDIVERINALRELRGIVGTGAGGHDYREVNALLPGYLKVRELVGDAGGNDLFRAVEMQGGARYKPDGEFDQARWEKFVDAGLRTIQAGGGNIKPADLKNVMQMASVTARGYDPDAFWNMMMTPMLEMGGHRAGTALTAMSRAFYGGIMPDRNARELERLGVLAGGQHIRTLPHMSREQRAEFKAQGYSVGRGGVVTVGRGALRGSGELNDPNEGFFPWLRDVFAPILRADYQKTVASRPGNTESFDAYVRDEMYKALPTETARRFGALIVSQLTSVQRDGTLRGQAPGLTAYDTAQQGFDKQRENVERSWKSLMETLGLPAARDGASILKAIAGGLDAVTQWAAKHPNGARDLERFALGLGAVAAISGAAAIAGVALGPLAAGVRLLSTATLGASVTGAGMASIATGMGLLAKAVPVLLAALGGYEVGTWLHDHTPLGAAADSLENSVKNHLRDGQQTSGAYKWLRDHLVGVPFSGGMTRAEHDAKVAQQKKLLENSLPTQPSSPAPSPYQVGPVPQWGNPRINPTAYEAGGGSMLQPINLTIQLDGQAIGRHVDTYQTRRASRPSPYGNAPDPMEVPYRPGSPVVAA